MYDIVYLFTLVLKNNIQLLLFLYSIPLPWFSPLPPMFAGEGHKWGMEGRKPLECLMKRQEALQPPWPLLIKQRRQTSPIPDLLLPAFIRTMYCPSPLNKRIWKKNLIEFLTKIYTIFLCVCCSLRIKRTYSHKLGQKA